MSSALRQFDVVVMPFPFVEREVERKRPAIILSSAGAMGATGIAVVAMVTRAAAAPWHGDIAVGDPDQAGLHKPSKIRMKLHSVTLGALDAPIGRLAPADADGVRAGLRNLFGL